MSVGRSPARTSSRWPSGLPPHYKDLRILEHQHPELTGGLCDVLPRKVLARLPSFPHPWPEGLAAELTPELVAEALLQLVPHVGCDTALASRFFQTIRDSRGRWHKEVSWHRGLVILPPLAAAHWLHQLVLGAPLQDARGRVRHLVIDYDGPRHLCDPETRHEALREIRAAGVPVWFATRPSCNREHSMHVYVLLDRPMPAKEAAEHVRRLLRTKPGAPPGQWCEILVGACRLPAGLDAARLHPATGAELKESPGEQLRAILQLRGTCDRFRVCGPRIRISGIGQNTRVGFAAGPGSDTCPNQSTLPLEAIAAAAEARTERYESAEAAGGERPRFGSVGPLPWDEPCEIAQLLRSGSVDPGYRNATARAIGHFAHAAGLDLDATLTAFDAITFQGATCTELRGWRADCTRSYARGAELLRNPAATEASMPMPDKLREIAAAELEQLPDDVRSRLEADVAEIPHRALRRAFLRVVGYTLARCRQGRPDVPASTLRTLVGTPRWCKPAIDRAVLLGWLRIEREADRLKHRCRRFAPGPQANAPAPDPVPGCIIEFPMQHRRFLGTPKDPKGHGLRITTPEDVTLARMRPWQGDEGIGGRWAPPERRGRRRRVLREPLPPPPTVAGESTVAELGKLAAGPCHRPRATACARRRARMSMRVRMRRAVSRASLRVAVRSRHTSGASGRNGGSGSACAARWLARRHLKVPVESEHTVRAETTPATTSSTRSVVPRASSSCATRQVRSKRAHSVCRHRGLRPCRHDADAIPDDQRRASVPIRHPVELQDRLARAAGAGNRH